MSSVIEQHPGTVESDVPMPLGAQLLKYGLAGIASCVVDLVGFYLLAHYLHPCIDDGLSDLVRSNRFAIDKTVAFLVANSFAYGLNAKWVFDANRHSKLTEVILFFASSTVTHLAGKQVGRMLIVGLSITSDAAAVLCIAIATILNFTVRKTLVFRC